MNVLGKKKNYIQIGTVMTDNEYRNKGLSRYLIEKIISEYKEKSDCIYLSANDTVLKNLKVTAKVDSFYSGIMHSEEKELKTNAAEGTINLTVINQVGSKLPVTGTPVVLIMVLSGSILMTVAVLSSKRKR